MQRAKVTLGFDWDANEAIPGVRKEEYRKLAEEVCDHSSRGVVVHRIRTDFRLTQYDMLRPLGDIERIAMLASRTKMMSQGLLRW
jgi:radical SAM superfamily enzyme